MKRFIECLIPVTSCNISCSYCYVGQQKRELGVVPSFKYSPEHIGKALSFQRLGGQSLISITGSGETLIPKQVPEVISNILKQGHFVNVTTNGTLTKRFNQILEFCGEMCSRLHFSFSLHYDELVKHNLLESFFNNVQLVRNAGCSILIQINLSDEYIEHWDEIKRLTEEKMGAAPQVALTRDESVRPFKIFTSLSDDEYIQLGRKMKSPLFDFTVDNFNKKQTEFCYAGAWSAKLDLTTGDMSGCYSFGVKQNIFANLNKPIKFEPIGKCPFDYCFNSSHFLSLGTIPTLQAESYEGLRNRPEAKWYSDEMQKFLSQKLSDDNELLSESRQDFYERKFQLINTIRRYYRKFGYAWQAIKNK
nr:radical SAM protein [uncultured Carboxylicivirga sp.]